MARLPPFDALVAFDAAVRHGSMTVAASELGLTQSAVSHRIRRLESFMSTSLLRRRSTGISPTPAGEALLEEVATVLVAMGGLRARCLAAAGPDRLRIGVGAALADNWLVRRLPDFAAAYPDITVELLAVENESPAYTADLALRILWVPAGEASSTSTQQPLFLERVFPVCHPSLLPSGFRPADPAVLVGMPLLHKGPTGSGSGAEWSWPAWMDRLGLPAKPKESFRFGTIGPAIAAALQGAGAVLARSMLVHDALAEGRLVRVLPEANDMASSKVHVARWPSALRGDRRVKSFTSWLVEQARETSGATPGGVAGRSF